MLLFACPPPLLKEGGGEAHKSVEHVPLLIIEVEGEPVAEPRPKVNATGARPRIYVPANAHPWKRLIRVRVLVELLRLGLAGVAPVQGRAFAVGFVFRFSRPKSHWRVGRRAGELKEWAVGLEHLVKPDLDNLIKAVKDAPGEWDGRPALLWADDSQVTRYVGTPLKRYVNPGEVAGLTMVVWVV